MSDIIFKDGKPITLQKFSLRELLNVDGWFDLSDEEKRMLIKFDLQEAKRQEAEDDEFFRLLKKINEI